ncbi:hypothetical protein SAMN06265346_104213 [Flavobacterium hercynium]|nr:hypothetical protein SAMN06265346_104213 [Flavobacterium hercynium]
MKKYTIRISTIFYSHPVGNRGEIEQETDF